MDVTPLGYLFTATNPPRGWSWAFPGSAAQSFPGCPARGLWQISVPNPAGDQQLSFNIATKPIKTSLVSGGAGSDPSLGKT